MITTVCAWLLIGLCVGWIGNRMAHGAGLGLPLYLLVGVIGAFVGAIGLSLVAPDQNTLYVLTGAGALAALGTAALFVLVSTLVTVRRDYSTRL
ncbi:MAG TPA: hypothetical protein VJR48_03285 [Ktedonobacterales bacterium]|nr:hypothetical protein [Ktedonobacterales bacterium]